MFWKLCRVASPSSVSCVKFDAQCLSLRSSRWWSLWPGKLATGRRQRRFHRHPAYLTRRLQSVLNAAARLIFNLRRSDHDADVRLWRTHQPSLAACSWAHHLQVQSCRPGVQGPSQLCTVVPWPVHFRCRSSKSPRTSLFLQRLPRSASGPPSIFGFWPLGVELAATGGYVGTASGDLPLPTQDVYVHWIISWHSADLKFCVYKLYSGPSSVLKT